MPTVTIDDIIAEHARSRLVLVKIDIEGAEATVFRTNLGWLAATPLLIIETHDAIQPFRRTSSAMFRALSTLPFEICFSGENAFVFIDPTLPPRVPGSADPTIGIPEGWSKFLQRGAGGHRTGGDGTAPVEPDSRLARAPA